MPFRNLLSPFAKEYLRVTDTATSEDDSRDEEDLLPPGADCKLESKNTSTRYKQKILVYAWLFIGLIALTVIVASTLLDTSRKPNSVIDDMCFEHSTYYSPVIRDIDTTPRAVVSNGSLSWPSIYRQPPGPEVDAAWNRISYDMGVFALPEEIALKAGLHKGDVRIPPGYEGNGDYMASLEVTHQLHCVNFLRKAVWFNYPHYKDHGDEFHDPQHVLEMHLYHCLETLRQAIMCNADPGIVGYKFVRGRERRPYPDFNTPHKCRDWQGMIDWAYEHMVPGHPEEDDFVPGSNEIIYDVDP